MSRVLLTVVLLDVGGFEILWVVDVVEDAAEGWNPVRVICKMRLASCIDDLSSINPGVSYFFTVAAMVVAAVLLGPWSLVCCRLSTPTVAASDFLILLVSLVLLLTVMASRGAARLRCYYRGSPGSGAMN